MYQQMIQLARALYQYMIRCIRSVVQFLGKPSEPSAPPLFSLFGLLRPLALAQAHARAASVLVDEFDAGVFQRAAECATVEVAPP